MDMDTETISLNIGAISTVEGMKGEDIIRVICGTSLVERLS